MKKSTNIQAIGLTETHIKESIIKQARGNKKYTAYHNGIEGMNKYLGVGILIQEEEEKPSSE